MKTIITIQHTQSIHHTNGMIGSWTDWELSPLGKEQAQTLARNLAREISDRQWVIYSSDLKRAKQTAQPLAKELNLSLIETPLLRERNLGSAVGKSVQWLHEHQQQPEETVDDRCLPDAESRREVWERLFPFCQELLESKEENIILVSHGDTLSIWNGIWLGLEPEDLNRCDLFGLAGGVSFFLSDGRKRVIKRLSDLSYLK